MDKPQPWRVKVIRSLKCQSVHTLFQRTPILQHGECGPVISRIIHLNHETFNLPTGATLLAYGEQVQNLAFLFRCAVGVQFHPEVTMPIINHGAKDLNATELIQLRQGSEMYVDQNRQRCVGMMDAFLDY
jgi:GMP synthase-like glutamine amidotransferase